MEWGLSLLSWVFSGLLKSSKSGDRNQTEYPSAKCQESLSHASGLERLIGPILRGTVLGFFLGLVPGGGAIIASFASYAIEKKVPNIRKNSERALFREWQGPKQRITPPPAGIHSSSYSGNSRQCRHGHPLRRADDSWFATRTALDAKAPDLFWGTIVSMYIGNAMLLVLNLPLSGSG